VGVIPLTRRDRDFLNCHHLAQPRRGRAPISAERFGNTMIGASTCLGASSRSRRANRRHGRYRLPCARDKARRPGARRACRALRCRETGDIFSGHRWPLIAIICASVRCCSMAASSRRWRPSAEDVGRFQVHMTGEGAQPPQLNSATSAIGPHSWANGLRARQERARQERGVMSQSKKPVTPLQHWGSGRSRAELRAQM
jgi:hypothetical protein